MTRTRMGKYRVLGHLGTGGMGTVYKALDETLEREVAIKVLNPGLTDPKILARFRAEATTLAKLNHPAIATIYELFECDDDLLIVMEFVRGETLERLAQRVGRLVPEQAVFVVDRVLSALAHTHRAGIVHCDIKPANVMVTAYGAVKIMDFGTARARGAEHGGAQGYMMGTPAYMPPEQLLGQPMDGRTDLYAVGVLFYRLVTGTLPFTADSPIEAMRKQISNAPAPASQQCPDLPDWCDYILTRALAKQPLDRFQSAEGFRDALRDASGFVSPESSGSFAAPIVDLSGASPAPTVVARVEPPSGHASRMARPLALLVAAAVSLLAVTPLRAPARSAGDALLAPPGIAPRTSTIRAREIVMPFATFALPASPSTDLESGDANPERPPVVYAFDARVVAGTPESQQQCKCRVVLANGRIIWRAEDDRHHTDAIAYDRVASMVYSHGRDPLWNTPGGPAPVVRASRGPFAALGFFSERDWLSLRVTDPHLRFVVLRFDDVGQARNAINALEARTGLRIERIAKRQS